MSTVYAEESVRWYHVRALPVSDREEVGTCIGLSRMASECSMRGDDAYMEASTSPTTDLMAQEREEAAATFES